MKKSNVLLYVLILVMSVTCVFAQETHDVLYLEKPLPRHGTTPREAAISLYRMDAELVDISTQVYSNIVKFAPEFYMQNDVGLTKLNPWKDMTLTELEIVKSWAADITAGCTTADQKIYAVMEYVANNVYYDMDFYNNFDGSNEQYRQMLNHNAYDVLTNKTAVCYGYAATASALLQMSGVPCVIIESPAHAWNMAYNGERWVLFDTTWISNNRYENGTFNTGSALVFEWYDFTLEKANSNYNHLITGADYCEYDNTIYTVPVYTASERFEIPDNITMISDYVFYEAGGIVITGDLRNVEYVGRSAFYNCYLYDGVINLENAEHIGEFAFYGCSGIDGITSLKNASYVGEAAFYNCSSIDGIAELGNVETVEGYAFFKCSSLDGVEGLENVTSIGTCAFYDCNELCGTIDIPAVDSIGENAFCFSNISEIYIPNNNITIGEYAFWACPLTVYAYPDSAANAYAVQNGIMFENIDSLEFTVTYDASGGSNAPEASVKRYGETVIISEVIPNKNGSEFFAWSLSPDGQADYYPGDVYTKNRDLSLYALWESIIIYGDSNSDGTVDVSDVILILQCIASSDTGSLSEGTDVNGDGIFDVSDVIRILQYIASPGTPLGPQ